MVGKHVLVVLLLCFVLVVVFSILSILPVRATTSIIRVPEDYLRIQEAVEASSPGDIILVSAGTYFEHLIVNKTLSLVGENRHTTIIDGNKTGLVLYLEADNVRLSGFTIRNGGGWSPYAGYGIILDSCNYSTIYGNIITSNLAGGIHMRESSGNLICNNQMLNNGDGPPDLQYGEGVWLWSSNNNIISNNSMSNNVVSGTVIDESHSNVVTGNTLTNNLLAVVLVSSTGNIISDNIITSNGNGFSIRYSAANTIEQNRIFRNGIGIGLGFSEKNTIKRNNITENTIHGIALADICPNNTIVGNIISRNRNGIKIHYCNGSFIHHNNFINNTKNVPGDVYPNVNTWDDGYPSGGNYWSDYNGTDYCNGFGQNLTGSDGIGDIRHTLDALNQDEFPLTAPISLLDAGFWNETSHVLHIVSNSTISSFQLNRTQKTVKFNVTYPAHTIGFCRLTIPNIILQDLWQNNYTVYVDREAPLEIRNWTDHTNTYIYFTYHYTTHEVTIIPEFSVTLIPLILILTTLIGSKLRKNNQKRSSTSLCS